MECWIGNLERSHSAATVPVSIWEGEEMIRDMDLIRDVLLRIEAKSDLVPEKITIEGYEPLIVDRHVELMFKAGLIDGYCQTGIEEGDPDFVDVRDLSWAGHELLGSVRDPDIWRNTKAALAKSGEWTIATMARVAQSLLFAKVREITGLDI